MISEIQALLRDRGQLTLRQLSRHFNTTPEAMEPILQKLIEKGRVKTSMLCGGGCSGCGCATAADLTLYELDTEG